MIVPVDDARIDVDVTGSGDAVVLLHGFPLTRAIWDRHVPELAQAHRVVRLDLRGMGASSVSDGPYLMESLAGDVAAVLDALHVDRATLVGHSLGGYVALAFARMYVERLRGLALVCSRLTADTPQQAADREALADRLERDGSIDAAVDAFMPRLFAAQTIAQRSDIIDAMTSIARANSPKGLAAMLRGMAQRSASDDIAPEIDVPVLVVAGELDAALPLDEARTIARTFAHGRLETIAGSGHTPMLEAPAEFARVLRGCWLP